MKLYMHPLSTVSRPVRLFIADNNIAVDEEIVDLMKGEHMGEAHSARNPSQLLPVLEDGDLRLTESSAILKYLADKINSPAYPKDLKARAKVNEAMDWFNTQFYRDFGYGLLYPQLFPHHKRRSDEAHTATIEWGKQNTKKWMSILNDHWIGSSKSYLCGNQITIADYFGACLLTAGDLIRCDLSAYPNIRRWLDAVQKQPGWAKTNEALYGLAGHLKEQQFVGL